MPGNLQPRMGFKIGSCFPKWHGPQWLTYSNILDMVSTTAWTTSLAVTPNPIATASFTVILTLLIDDRRYMHKFGDLYRYLGLGALWESVKAKGLLYRVGYTFKDYFNILNPFTEDNATMRCKKFVLHPYTADAIQLTALANYLNASINPDDDLVAIESMNVTLSTAILGIFGIMLPTILRKVQSTYTAAKDENDTVATSKDTIKPTATNDTVITIHDDSELQQGNRPPNNNAALSQDTTISTATTNHDVVINMNEISTDTIKPIAANDTDIVITIHGRKDEKYELLLSEQSEQNSELTKNMNMLESTYNELYKQFQALQSAASSVKVASISIEKKSIHPPTGLIKKSFSSNDLNSSNHALWLNIKYGKQFTEQLPESNLPELTKMEGLKKIN